MMDFEFVRPDADIIEALADQLSTADKLELWRFSALTPRIAVAQSVFEAKEARIVTANGELLGIYGLREDPWLDTSDARTAMPWALTTPRARDFRLSLTKLAKTMLSEWFEDYTVLSNWVDASNVAGMQWLEAMGFRMTPPQPMGPFGRDFIHFHMTAPVH